MLSVDDLVYSGITLAKAAYVAVIATCGAQVVSGTGTCAASEGRLPLPVYVLALITLVGLGVWLHSWVSEAWENEEGVFGTVSALRFRFGDRVKLPLREKTGTPEWWAKQVVVVTGGAGGLGWATSGRILAQGARVAVWDVKEPQALFHASDKELLTPSQRSRIMFTKCNVADRQSVIAAVADLQAKFGPATVLVNNAGIQSGVGKTLDKLSGEEVTRIFGINVLSHFWTLQALLPDMLKTGTGHIVSIASIMGQMPIAHLCTSATLVLGQWSDHSQPTMWRQSTRSRECITLCGESWTTCITRLSCGRLM